jgi:hypothetical protein
MNMENSSSIRVTVRPRGKNDRKVILKVTQVRVVGSKEVTKRWQRVNTLARAVLPKFVDNFEAMMHNYNVQRSRRRSSRRQNFV